MIQLLMLLSLAAPQPTEQIQPCVWPNKCSVEPVMAQVTTCVWPNKCSAEPVLAQITTCQWPNRCAELPPVS